MSSTDHGRKRIRLESRLQEMKALVGFRNDKASFKKPYFVVPTGVSFSAIPTALLESEVWSALRIYEYRFITAILIARARAGGFKNGRLVLTHEQLKERRITGDQIKPVIASLVSLGLLEVTHRGGPADPAKDDRDVTIAHLQAKLSTMIDAAY